MSTLKHLSVSLEQESNIAMEGMWDNIKDYFIRRQKIIKDKSMFEKDKFNYYDIKNINAFFTKLQGQDLEFKPGNGKSTIHTAFLTMNGKCVPDVVVTLSKEADSLRHMHSMSREADLTFSKTLRRAYREANDSYDRYDLAAVYDKYERDLKKTPVIGIKAHEFLGNVQFARLIKKDSGYQEVFHEEIFYGLIKNNRGINIPYCTAKDIPTLQLVVANLVDVALKIQAKWDDFDFPSSGGMDSLWSDLTAAEDLSTDAVRLESLICDHDRSYHYPYIFQVCWAMVTSLLEAICNWVRESIVDLKGL